MLTDVPSTVHNLHVLKNPSQYVYILQDGGRTYVGCTQDLHLRLAQHNGVVPGGADMTHTRAGRWRLAAFASGITSRHLALRLEAAVQQPTKCRWAHGSLSPRELRELQRPGIASKVTGLYTLLQALAREQHLPARDLCVHLLATTELERWTPNANAPAITVTRRPVYQPNPAPIGRAAPQRTTAADTDALLAPLAAAPVTDVNAANAGITAALQAYAGPARARNPARPPPHRVTRPAKRLTIAEAGHLHLTNRRDLHRRIEAQQAPALAIPAAALAAYHRDEAGAAHGLPQIATALSALPPRAPYGTHAADAALSAPITTAEVERHIRAMRAHAASDADGIAGRHFRDLARRSDDDDPPRPLVTALTRMFNFVMANADSPDAWRTATCTLLPKPGKDLTLPASWRHIALIRMAPKLFAAIQSARVTLFMSQPGRLHTAQHGFLPRVGTKSHAIHLRLLLEDAQRSRSDLVLVMVDIRNAFGTVSHEALLGTLSAYCVPDNVINLLKKLYRNNELILPDGDLVAMERGVQQGSPLSPIVFVTAIDPALHAAEAADLAGTQQAFADDVNLISVTTTGAQAQLDAVDAHLRATGQSISVPKCLVVCLRAGRLSDPPTPVTLNGAPLPVLQRGGNFTYLGHTWTATAGGKLSLRDAATAGLAETCRRARLISNTPMPPLAALTALMSWAAPAGLYAATVGDVLLGDLDRVDDFLRQTARQLLPSKAGTPFGTFAPNAYLNGPASDGGLATPILRRQHVIERLSLLLKCLLGPTDHRLAAAHAAARADFARGPGQSCALWTWMRHTLAQLDLALEPTGLASARTYAHVENVSEHIRAMPLGSTVIFVRRAGALLASASFNFGGAHVDHEAHATDAGGMTPLSHSLEAATRARLTWPGPTLIVLESPALPLHSWSAPPLDATDVALAVQALARAKGEIWIVSTPALPTALRGLLPRAATAPTLDRAAWPAPLGAPVGLPAPVRPRHPGTPMACVHDVLRAEHLHEWLGLSGLSRYAVATHAVTSSLSAGIRPSPLAPVAVVRMLAQLRFDASPVLRTTRLRMRLQPVPPSNRCPFGCGAADNMSHLLSGCTQYTAAYIARHDRVVRRIGEMVQKRTPPPDHLDLITAQHLATAVPAWVSPQLTQPIPPTVTHTRPDIWLLGNNRLALIEVAVAGDTLARQVEVAAGKRATYAPLLAHLKAHCGTWTVSLTVIVAGHRGIIHPAALSGLTSVLTALDTPKRQAGKLAKQTLQACSVSCVADATTILRMRQGHPAHGYVH